MNVLNASSLILVFKSIAVTHCKSLRYSLQHSICFQTFLSTVTEMKFGSFVPSSYLFGAYGNNFGFLSSFRMVDDLRFLFSNKTSHEKPLLLVGAELGAVNVRFYAQMYQE